MVSSGNWSFSSQSSGKLSSGLSIARAAEPQRTAPWIVRGMRRAMALLAACFMAFGLLLLLSGFSDIPPGEGDGRRGQANLGVDAWQELTEGLVKRASEFQVLVALGDGEPSAKLAIETRVAFENKQDRLTPDYARFLATITPLLQMTPNLKLAITGFGNNPAKDYNPVLLGKRVRAVQVYFAENGIPIDHIEASVKEAEAYEGPNTLIAKASSGEVITVQFQPA